MAGIVDAGVAFATSYDTYLDNVRFALRTFAPHGVGVLIEPINTVNVPGYFIGDIDIARQAVADLGGGDAAVMFDAYHIAMDGRDPAATLREAYADVRHIQIADAPGRHEPFSGAIDFHRLFATIDDLGYDGWVSCEYFPAGDTRAGLSWRSRLRSQSVAFAS
jgi:hydroxypyruvate isomerase